MPTSPLTADGRVRALADANHMPMLGLGVWQVPNGAECVNAVRWALELGYRHIDTAQAYGNEESVGRGLRESGVPRDDVFITTKFDPAHKDPAAEAGQSLKRLGVDHVDLYIVHWPQRGPTWAWPGMERAREMYRAFDAGVDLVESLVRSEGIDCDFSRSGKLKLAAKPEHFDKLVRAQEVLAKEVDADTAIVAKPDLGREIATERYYGGLLQRRSASMHMGKFGIGLAHAATQAGAVIHQNAAVIAIDRIAHGRFRLKTAHATIEADQVLLATGASQEGPFGWFRRRIVEREAGIVRHVPAPEQSAR